MQATQPTLQRQISEIRTAYFQAYSDGTRFLKIRSKEGWLDLIDLTNEATLAYSKSRNQRLHDVIDHCLALGFQHDTYAIDNRTQVEYYRDWLDHRDRCAVHGIAADCFEVWRDRQVLAF